MAEKFRWTASKPARLLYSSITQRSAPRGVANAEPKFSGTFGLEGEDWGSIKGEMVKAIQSETGGFSGNPLDYYLACMPGKMAADRVLQKANLDAMGKTPDEAFKIMEKAEKRGTLYREYAGILQASSKFDIELAQLVGGAIKDIVEDHARAQAGKDLFYPGSFVVPAISLQGFRRKKLDDKDGVTAFLQNCLFIRKGPKIDTGGGPSNSDVFSGFQGYSDYDPLAMAPGGDSAGWGGDGNAVQQPQTSGNAGFSGGAQQQPPSDPAW